jgi:hypothetical protein
MRLRFSAGRRDFDPRRSTHFRMLATGLAFLLM